MALAASAFAWLAASDAFCWGLGPQATTVSAAIAAPAMRALRSVSEVMGVGSSPLRLRRRRGATQRTRPLTACPKRSASSFVDALAQPIVAGQRSFAVGLDPPRAHQLDH